MYEYQARIISVYDGDTVNADIDLGLETHRLIKIRLYGINAPEMTGDTRMAGLMARDILRARILDKVVVMRTIKDRTEKYGRYLGIISDDNGVVNDWMVSSGHAVVYLP